MQYIRDIDPVLAPHADLFRKHVRINWSLLALSFGVFVQLLHQNCALVPSSGLQEIDGKALLLLRSDMMMKYMGLKLGPALKLTFHIDKLKRF